MIATDIEHLKLYVSVAGLIGTAVAAFVAYNSFQRTEKWKKAEFLANEMKEFFDGDRVNKAKLMIDWGLRRVQLLGHDEANTGIVVVTRAMQVQALRPHILLMIEGSDPEADEGSLDGAADRYSRAQAEIRDCYDAFLDGLERFANYARTGLTTVDALRPYIGYWIKDIHAPTKDKADSAWSAALLTYISFYGFEEVLWLFHSFGCDIGSKGSAYVGFLSGMADQDLARRLAATVQLNYVPRYNAAQPHPSHSDSHVKQPSV